jgi:FtsP/CotA-like multicopper oxidase with cupredoxin domain
MEEYMSKMKSRVLAGVFICTPLVAGIQTASAQAVPGGTLDPLSIPKYVTPLVIPPVLHDDGGMGMSVEVALREISQQVLPAGFPATPLWAYGDPANPATFNNPGFTIEVTKDVATTVTWINDLVDANGDFLPHIIQDENGVPIVDQTLHWAAPNQDCLDGIPRTDCRGASADPYTGPIPMVTHVHGAHVNPTSDGYPEAWWLPNANNIPAGYDTTGTFYDTTAPADPGTAVYSYENDQPTATLWYHDHSLGMTRLNVYAAGAGFWMIRNGDDSETGVVSGTLPGPAPKAGEDPNGDPAVRSAIREIPIAIQPKSFNADGTQYYPADRAFFEGLGTGGIFADNTDLNIPFLPQGTSDIAPVWNPEAFFNTMVVNGNTWPQMEVAPERYRLRFVNASDSRFMNLALFRVRGNGEIGNQELPFYVIGSEQGLLPQVVRVESGFATPLPGDGRDTCQGNAGTNPTQGQGQGGQNPNCVTRVPGTFAEQALLMGPAERPDVIVDFTGLPNGTIVRMINTAPDAPFGGFPDVPADPATTGQVMQFVVNRDLSNPLGDPSTPAASLVLDPNPGGVAKLGASTVTQDLALLEEESALLCVTIDAVTGVIDLDPNSVPPTCDPVLGSVPFAPKAAVLGVEGSLGGTPQLWDDPISTNPAVGDIQTWELWNHSADAHPIHLHLVKFEVLDRALVGAPVATRRAAEPWEAGWKDTVIAYPGEVTRIKALFDVAGLYVWHCHILSHEDNEMMVPYCVGEIGVDCPDI